MFPFTTILHPTDFSPHSRSALQLAVSLARAHGARLVVLHVAQPAVVMYDERGSVLERPRDYRRAAAERLTRLVASLGGLRVESRVEVGEAGATILRVAEEIPADLLVLGTHGRTGVDRLVIGSVAESVVRKAPCPVLLAKAPPPQALPATGGHAREAVHGA